MNCMHPLDNVIWQALTTRQAEFAESLLQARRFSSKISPLGAFLQPTDEGYESLAGLLGTGGTGGLFLDAPYESRPGWESVGGAPLLQMICENGGPREPTSAFGSRFVELAQFDVPEMLDLAALTKPGPFAHRTRELGTYLGIRMNGRLVAMAGERLKVPGYTEVSAVCTHPEHVGKGYARILMAEVMRRTRDRGEIPFLHVRQDNVRAIELYKRLGFRERVLLHYVMLRRD